MRVLLAVLAVLAIVCAQPDGTPFDPITDCNNYCGNISIATVCNGTGNPFTNLGYADVNACAAACRAMAFAVNDSLGQFSFNFAGFIGNQTGNTMACRLYHIQAAIDTDDDVHCGHASIHGGGNCGAGAQDLCGTYCTLTGAFCPESFGGTYALPPAAPSGFQGGFCGQMCALTYNFPSDNAMPVVQSGDSIQCRLYHLTAAAILRNTGTGYQHCAHASPLGGGVCRAAGSENGRFCAQVAANCQGANAQYASNQDCLDDAVTYNQTDLVEQWGSVNSSSGDTLGCRFYHSGLPSVADAATHCPHAGFTGGGVCGNRPSTAGPTTAAPATTDAASSVLVSVFVVLAALALALF